MKTFLSVFIILLMIFVLQGIWLYISELAGKDLDLPIILKFLWFYSPRIVPLVLPLSILVTSLMVFGSFAEKYEFAAMKSTGISLQRAMRSLMVFILLLSVVAFFFANNVIPYSEYKWQNLRRNIAQVSPSMVIAEGQFTEIGDAFNIKVSEKYGDRDQFLKDVVIHQKNPDKPNGNYKVMLADTGELASEEGSNTLSLILRDGNYYEDVQIKDVRKRNRKPFAKSAFEEYTINIDLTELNNTDMEKDNEFENQNMYNISELAVEIDSLSGSLSKDINAFAENMYYRSGMSKFQGKTLLSKKEEQKDTTRFIMEVFNPRRKSEIVTLALNNVRGTLQSVKSKKLDFLKKTKRLNKHKLALQDKYVLGAACIILFFVGAPLGAIIRKGGMGLPMVVAILLFLTYHFIGIFAKNSSEDGTLHPFMAAWVSTLIMLPLSVWLTYRATTDQGIFDFDSFLQRFKWLKKKETLDAAISNEAPMVLTQQEKALLLSKDEAQLKDILKNYRQYNYTEDMRRAALEQLKLKGYSEVGLKISGDFENTQYTAAEKAYKSFSKSSNYALIFYGASLITLFLFIGSFFFDFSAPETVGNALLYLRWTCIILFYIFAIQAAINNIKFYKALQKDRENSVWIFIMLGGLLIYVFVHFNVKKKMKEDLEMIR